jgi:hypothetical protein
MKSIPLYQLSTSLPSLSSHFVTSSSLSIGNTIAAMVSIARTTAIGPCSTNQSTKGCSIFFYTPPTLDHLSSRISLALSLDFPATLDRLEPELIGPSTLEVIRDSE